ncbi:hypothetical protein [Fodinicurvata sediminis]|uniref:hypothetical protein n=1 Tax=Fodinicurvata sediminis TaxID=1121832 RepID=UPI0003B6424B|nr:hypothetical protein [Fodinicurvata sediminis]
MSFFQGRIIGAVSALFLIAGCTTPGGDPGSQTGGGSVQSPLILGTGTFEPEGVPSFQSTGTDVGGRVQSLREDLVDIQDQLRSENETLQAQRQQSRESAQSYHALKSDINAKLQVGTTPGNPRLVSQWNQAQSELAQVDQSIQQMNSLSSEVSSTASQTGYLLDSIRSTFGLSGAVDEDHAHLTVLEDAANQTAVLVDRLDSELTEDIQRQTAYLSTERSNLNALSVAIENGQSTGVSLSNRIYGQASAPPPGGASSRLGQERPLAIITFQNENTRYEPQLYNAVNQVLERRPNAGFDVLAVAPQGNSEGESALATNRTRRDGERVMRSLASMGLPAARLSLSATSSPLVSNGEVHVYVR